MEANQNIKYLQAKRQVKRIKGFYIHLFIFLIINSFGIIDAVTKGQEFYAENWVGTALWILGVGLHGFFVFVPNFLFGKDWEERKIREILDRNK